MTRSDFLKLALGTVTLPSTLIGRGVPDAPQKIAHAKDEVQLQLDYHLIGGCVFCSTEHPESIAMGTRQKQPRHSSLH